MKPAPGTLLALADAAHTEHRCPAHPSGMCTACHGRWPCDARLAMDVLAEIRDRIIREITVLPFVSDKAAAVIAAKIIGMSPCREPATRPGRPGRIVSRTAAGDRQ